MENLLKNIKIFVKRETLGILKSLFRSFLLASIIFFVFYIILPKEATIFFEGKTGYSYFRVLEEGRASFDIIGELNIGSVIFESDITSGSFNKNIFVADAQIVEEIDFNHINEFNYDKEHIFAFKNGNGQLKSENKFSLFIRMPDDKPFSYDLNIQHADKDTPYWDMTSRNENLITISNFPREAIIYLRCDSEATTPGSDIIIPAAQYRIINCDRIRFFVAGQQMGDSNSDTYEYIKFDETITEFSIENNDTGQLEFTVTSDTDYKKLGHVNLKGKAKNNNLTVNINDLGEYPLPIQLEGDVKEMEVAGKSCYITLRQWIVDNMTQILSILITAMLTDVLSKKKRENTSD